MMLVKQIDMKTALKLAAAGKEINILCPSGPESDWTDLMPDTLQNLLEGCLFFRSELAMVNQDFEDAVLEMEEEPKPASEITPEISETESPAAVVTKKRRGGGGKRTGTMQKKTDTGKLHALHKAGWTAAKIADEMGISVATVYNHLNRKEETDKDESISMQPVCKT